jgi:single-strand DNA-binding protein
MSYNKILLVGRLGSDVAIDQTNTGATPIARGSIAVSESYQDKKTKEWKEVVDWIQLRFYDKMAKSASERIKKGMEVFIEGKLKTWKFERGGKTEYATAVKVEKFLLFKGSNPKGSDGAVIPSEDMESDNNSPF